MGVSPTALFQRIRAPLTNQFWSWGAVREDGSVVLRVWEDERRKVDGKHFIRLVNHGAYAEDLDNLGYRERLRHLELIRAGAMAYLVMCRAVDPTQSPRKIRSLDTRQVITLGEVKMIEGDEWGEIGPRVAVRDLAA